MRPLQSLIDRQFAAILPGDATHPAYSRIRAHVFWTNWESRAPLSVKLGLAACSLVLFLYGFLLRLLTLGLGHATLEAQLDAAQHSRLPLVAQSVGLLKVMAAMAYFSDPAAQARVRTRAGLAT